MDVAKCVRSVKILFNGRDITQAPPTSGRGWASAETFKIIRRLYRQGVSILLVEQNARKALAVADRGYVLETGEILLSGPSRELASDPMVKKAYLGA